MSEKSLMKLYMYMMTKKYENEKDIFDEEIEKINKEIFGQ